MRPARAAGGQCHGQDQHDGPKAEDDLHLANEVKEPGVPGVAVCQALELLCSEGVDQRYGKDDGRDDLHRRLLSRVHGRP